MGEKANSVTGLRINVPFRVRFHTEAAAFAGGQVENEGDKYMCRTDEDKFNPYHT